MVLQVNSPAVGLYPRLANFQREGSFWRNPRNLIGIWETGFKSAQHKHSSQLLVFVRKLQQTPKSIRCTQLFFFPEKTYNPHMMREGCVTDQQTNQFSWWKCYIHSSPQWADVIVKKNKKWTACCVSEAGTRHSRTLVENNTMTKQQNSVLAVPVTLEITSSGIHCILCSQPLLIRLLLSRGWCVRRVKPVLVTGTNQISDSQRKMGKFGKVSQNKKQKCVQKNTF